MKEKNIYNRKKERKKERKKKGVTVNPDPIWHHQRL
jgi:hypothetical protein